MCRKIIKGDRYLRGSGYPKNCLRLSQLAGSSRRAARASLGMDTSARSKDKYQ